MLRCWWGGAIYPTVPLSSTPGLARYRGVWMGIKQENILHRNFQISPEKLKEKKENVRKSSVFEIMQPWDDWMVSQHAAWSVSTCSHSASQLLPLDYQVGNLAGLPCHHPDTSNVIQTFYLITEQNQPSIHHRPSGINIRDCSALERRSTVEKVGISSVLFVYMKDEGHLVS